MKGWEWVMLAIVIGFFAAAIVAMTYRGDGK